MTRRRSTRGRAEGGARPRPKKRFGQHFLAPAWAAKVVAAINPEPGDVFLCNDPYHGFNTHLPDWGFFRPIFHNGELLFWSLARGHQQRGEHDRAIQAFERAVQEFRKLMVLHPRGERVPTALYKEALALTELGQLKQAESRLQFLVDQFPSTEEAAKARDELARLKRR